MMTMARREFLKILGISGIFPKVSLKILQKQENQVSIKKFGENSIHLDGDPYIDKIILYARGGIGMLGYIEDMKEIWVKRSIGKIVIPECLILIDLTEPILSNFIFLFDKPIGWNVMKYIEDPFQTRIPQKMDFEASIICWSSVFQDYKEIQSPFLQKIKGIRLILKLSKDSYFWSNKKTGLKHLVSNDLS